MQLHCPGCQRCGGALQRPGFDAWPARENRSMSVAVAFLNHRCISFYDWTRRRWIHVLMAGVLYGLVFHFLSVNLTPSLPYTLVWVDYGAQPGLGDLMVFRYEGRPFHDEDLSGLRFFKRVGGVAGDLITVDD